MMKKDTGDVDKQAYEKALNDCVDAFARAACQKLMTAVTDSYKAARFACLGSLDGRLVATAGSAERASAEQLCAFTSSFFALSDAFSDKSMSSRSNYSVVATDRGAIVISKVKTNKATYALSLGADDTQVLAMTLRHTLDLSAKLGIVLTEFSF